MSNPFWNTVLVLLGCSGAWTAAVELIKWLISRKNGIKKDIRCISEKVDQIDDRIVQEREERESDVAKAKRGRIVRFNDELLENRPHSKSMFDTILIDCTDYETYCDKHPGFMNGVAKEAIANIRRCYRTFEATNMFLSNSKE